MFRKKGTAAGYKCCRAFLLFSVRGLGEALRILLGHLAPNRI